MALAQPFDEIGEADHATFDLQESPPHASPCLGTHHLQPTVSCDYVEADYVGTNVSCRWYNSHVCTMNYC